MKILVTGGGGFVGSHLVPFLERSGLGVRVLDLFEPTFDCVDFVRGDVRDPVAVDKAMDGIDAVVHLAAAHHDFGISHQTFFDVNENGMRVLTEAMSAHDVRDICFFSSVAVYGDAAPPIDEGSTPLPNNDYGASKLAAEAVLNQWANAGLDRRAFVLRPTVIFGENNFANMFSLIRQIDRRRFLQVGAGSNIKSICFVENLVAAVEQMWLSDADRSSFAVFNYVDNPDLTSSEIAAAIAQALGQSRPTRIPYGVGKLMAMPFDLVTAVTGVDLGVSSLRIQKLAKAETKFEADRIRDAGFVQPVELLDGIRRMVEWYQSRRGEPQPSHRIPPAEVSRFDVAPTSDVVSPLGT